MGVTHPRPLNVLVIEDHRDTARAMKVLLTLDGHRVTTADGCAEALSVAGENRFDVFVCDVDLGDGDGCDLLCRLRGVHPPATAIAVTGHTSPEARDRVEAAGFDDCLEKPLDYQRLRSALTRTLAATDISAGRASQIDRPRRAMPVP